MSIKIPTDDSMGSILINNLIVCIYIFLIISFAQMFDVHPYIIITWAVMVLATFYRWNIERINKEKTTDLGDLYKQLEIPKGRWGR